MRAPDQAQPVHLPAPKEVRDLLGSSRRHVVPLLARLVAARQEIDFSEFPFKRARIFDVVGSPRLRHRVEANGFFAAPGGGGRPRELAGRPPHGDPARR